MIYKIRNCFLLKILAIKPVAWLFILNFVAIGTSGQVLPKPNHQNTFFMMPLFEEIRSTNLNEMTIRSEMDKMTSQLSAGNLYHHIGVSGIFGGYVMGARTCRLAKEKGMRVGIIVGTQTHTNPGYFPTLNQDIRCYQWRLNGIDWLFSAEQGTGDVLYPGELRDSGVYSPSRLCTLVRNKLMGQIATTTAEVLRLRAEFPGVISITNGIIEQELATGGQSNDAYLGDYSPYAITEYRDWLRHTGIYDAVTGTYKGEGAPAAIIGNLIQINGVFRSQFYDDPTPANANGTGVSFNTFFGTSFTTWTNRYYDLVAFPNAIPIPRVSDPPFDPTPESGNGFTAGGFDAPRVRNASGAFWKSWSWDVFDQGGAYPSGNPANPAFGFRQQMTKNYIKDVFKAYADGGLPTEDMYPHQIPGEVISAGRLRSGADPIWTGHLASSNNVGITRFGYIDPAKVTQYGPSWGIFEWHPMPFAKPTNQALYNTATSHLNTYYQRGCHALFPGWWRYNKDTVFYLPDSKFADAIKDFMVARKDQPYTRKDSTLINYTPPQVQNVEVLLLNGTTHLVRWPQEIWADYPETWRMWSQLSVFDIEQSTDNVNWSTVSSEYSFSKVLPNRQAGTTYYYRVRASSKVGLKGAWSQAISPVTKLAITADYTTIAPLDPNLINNITITLKDNANNTSNLTTYASGGFFTRTDTATSKFSVDFTNNNHAETPTDVKMTLTNTVTRNLSDTVLVKFTPPVGGTIDAVTFNYFCNYNNAIASLVVIDDSNRVVWENDVYGLSNGYKGVHFPSTSASFTLCLKMKQASSAGAGWFAQVSGINITYSKKIIATEGSVNCVVTGAGLALNTLPSNYLQASNLFQLDSSTEIVATNQLTAISYANGLLTATTNGNDGYITFNQSSPINGQANPYIYFRVFCSQAIPNAQFFWFKTAFVNTTFALAKGWNVIQLQNLPEWINSTNITRLRLDFGSVAGVTVKVDWLATSSQPNSGSLISLLTLVNGQAVLPTSCTGVVGSYKIVATLGNITDSIIINSNNTLPVSLISFSATKENKRVKLNWETSSEINNDFYSIERSSDGISFTTLGTVKSNNGNSTISQVYTWYDELPAIGINYYRLTQVDKDGKMQIKGIKSVSFDQGLSSSILIYPNPSVGIFNLSKTTSWQVFDMQGKPIKYGKSKTINLSNTAKGSYTVKFDDGTCQKIVLQ